MLDSIKIFISQLANDDMVCQDSICDSLAISLASYTENLRNSTILEFVVDKALAGNGTYVIGVKDR